MEDKMRLQKYMSQAGICSRRKAEEYIEKGLVTVNGQVATIGQSICPDEDEIKLLDKAIKEQKNLVYYKLNKPRGIVSTCVSREDTGILDIVDIKERVFPIGRLDKETTGLILLTNDGRLTNYLIHPRYKHSKQYLVEVFGPVSDDQLYELSQPMFILGNYTKKTKTERLSSGKFYITLTEGKNRQIRRMVESIGLEVKKLKRVRIENIELGKLEIGEYKHLTKGEKNDLFDIIGLK